MKTLLRLESIATAALILAAYAHLGGSWLMFGILFLVPDVSMLGYLVNPRIGSYTYNAVHTYAFPIALYLVSPQIALIAAAHIAVDRVMGYGLKSPTSFTETHLGAKVTA